MERNRSWNGTSLASAEGFMAKPEGLETNPYKILNVPTSATKDDITRAHRSLSITLHPDKHPKGNIFAKLPVQTRASFSFMKTKNPPSGTVIFFTASIFENRR